jgi:hypothetical protein
VPIERDSNGVVLRLGLARPLSDQQRYDLERLRLKLEKADRCPFCGPNMISGCPGCLREVEHEVGLARRRMEMEVRE